MTSTYDTQPTYSSKILVRGSGEYERCRRNPTAGAPDRFPREIHVVHSPDDVSRALLRAAELGVAVGVRSGGHAFSLGALVHDGIMVDTACLNREIEYDAQTQEISFGPAVRVEELSARLGAVGRFFPHGHAPTVGSAGFLMAGGQGWFVRGWGATCQTWITKIEVVVPDGRVVTASKTENQDVFWAARGSGLAFFGVITKFWGRTIRASTLWERTFTFELGDRFKELMTWFIDKSNNTPKYGTDLNLTIHYPEKYSSATDTDEIPRNSRLHLGLSLLCYADTHGEARTLLSAFDDIPTGLQQCLVEMRPVQRRDFQDIFQKKRGLIGGAQNERWQIISLLNDPSVPIPEVRKIPPSPSNATYLRVPFSPALMLIPSLTAPRRNQTRPLRSSDSKVFSFHVRLRYRSRRGRVSPEHSPAILHLDHHWLDGHRAGASRATSDAGSIQESAARLLRHLYRRLRHHV